MKRNGFEYNPTSLLIFTISHTNQRFFRWNQIPSVSWLTTEVIRLQPSLPLERFSESSSQSI